MTKLTSMLDQASVPDNQESEAQAFDRRASGFQSSPASEPKKDTQIINEKVMIVCDNSLNIEVMRTFLEQFGYVNIETTSDVSQVFNLILQGRPDVVLFENMDLRETDFEVLKKIRSNKTTQRAPILILTAFAEYESKLKALELGVVDILVKPLSSNELALRLRNILSVKTYHDHIEHFDALTSLPNRESFLEKLDAALKYSKRNNTLGAVLQINLKRFKHVNDALGPVVGDRLLKGVAYRLKSVMEESDFLPITEDERSDLVVSRLSGDEFSVLLPAIAHAEYAAMAAQKIQERMILPFYIGDKELYINCNIGIAVFPDDGQSKDAILHGAGVSLNRMKQEGLVGYKFYSKKLDDKLMYRFAMESAMRKALDDEQFKIFYQPKINLHTKEIVGAEALIRWQHPENGYINPTEFIPLAEETGFILPIGKWVISAVMSQIADWLAAGVHVPRIAINVSNHQFRQMEFLRSIQTEVAAKNIDPKYLSIELTESAVMSNTSETIEVLNALKEMGIKLSIDDFGTGYSSLSYLKKLPLDEIKIDRSFVMDIGKENNSEAIVVAIIAMAHSLGMTVVAEGVETAEHLIFLEQHQCDEYQGHLFSMAIPAESFSAMLRCE